MSILSTIQVSLSGIVAQQQAIEVTSHNIANANTKGYHRQEVHLSAAASYPEPGNTNSRTQGLFGTGVTLAEIRRLSDAFVQQQLQNSQQQVGYWNMMSEGLSQIESVVTPGQGLDISSMLDSFFGAWQTLSTRPEELSSRQGVRTAAINLANTLNNMAGQLHYYETQTSVNIQTKVEQFNQLSDNLARLNAKIGMARAVGNAPNDYIDQRDQVLIEMAQLAGAGTLSFDDASGIVSLGGHTLVDGSKAYHISQPSISSDGLVWDDGSAVTGLGGEIASLFALRDTVIPEYLAELDTIAANLTSSVNALHSTGVTPSGAAAGDIFTGTSAGSIRVADAVMNDAGAIAATTQADAPGDGSLATSIFQLNATPVQNNQTLNQLAQSLISRVGNAVKSSNSNVEVHAALRDMALYRDTQVGGVSLDEEMANLVVYQRAYDASARVLQTSKEMLDVLLGL